MIDEVLEKGAKKKQPTISNTVLSAKSKSFIPSRFSVRRLRKHPGIKSGRTPLIMS